MLCGSVRMFEGSLLSNGGHLTRRFTEVMLIFVNLFESQSAHFTMLLAASLFDLRTGFFPLLKATTSKKPLAPPRRTWLDLIVRVLRLLVIFMINKNVRRPGSAASTSIRVLQYNTHIWLNRFSCLATNGIANHQHRQATTAPCRSLVQELGWFG